MNAATIKSFSFGTMQSVVAFSVGLCYTAFIADIALLQIILKCRRSGAQSGVSHGVEEIARRAR